MLAFILSVSCAAAETFKTRVEPLDGEKWWGAATTLGDIMPFPTDTKSFDLLKNDFGNQASPLLLSSKGRYVWSEEPFSFKFEKGARSKSTPRYGGFRISKNCIKNKNGL